MNRNAGQERQETGGGEVPRHVQKGLRAVEKAKGKRDVEALMGVALKTSGVEPPVREAAYQALKSLGDPSIVDQVAGAFNNWFPESRRRYVAECLAVLGDRRAVGPLVEALLDQKDWNVRIATARALGILGDPRAAKALRSVLGGPHLGLEEEAAKALENLGVEAPVATHEAGFTDRQRIPGEIEGSARCAACGGPAFTTLEFVAAAREVGFEVDPLTGDAKYTVSGVASGVGDLLVAEQDGQRRYDRIEARRGYVCKSCEKLHCTACLMEAPQHSVTRGPRCPSCGEGPHDLFEGGQAAQYSFVRARQR